MNEPIGRFGSCRPERLRRTALATASTASSWPTRRWWIRSSSTSSFARSVSIIRATGMPVQALTTSAISSGPTSWRKQAAAVPCGSAVPAASAFSNWLGELLALRGPARRAADSRPRRRAWPDDCFSLIAAASWLYCSSTSASRLADLVDVAQPALFQSPTARAGRPACRAARPSPLRSRRSRSWACSSVSSASCRAASSSCTSRRCTSSISLGTLSSSIASRLVASSIRSIALSGRKRSVM